jgi:hypothetical protein
MLLKEHRHALLVPSSSCHSLLLEKENGRKLRFFFLPLFHGHVWTASEILEPCLLSASTRLTIAWAVKVHLKHSMLLEIDLDRVLGSQVLRYHLRIWCTPWLTKRKLTWADENHEWIG